MSCQPGPEGRDGGDGGCDTVAEVAEVRGGDHGESVAVSGSGGSVQVMFILVDFAVAVHELEGLSGLKVLLSPLETETGASLFVLAFLSKL